MGCCSSPSLKFLAEAGLFDDVRSLAGFSDLRPEPPSVGAGSGSATDKILHNGNFVLTVSAH